MFDGKIKSILDFDKAFPNEQACIDYLEHIRWKGNVVSPFDPSSKVYKCKNNRYRCKNTGKYFNVKTKTLFDNTKKPLKVWFIAIWLITSHKKGISSLQLGRDLGITQKTAWFMLCRIRKCFGLKKKEDNDQLKGEVEIDETYIGGKSKNRHASIRKDKSFETVDRFRKSTVLGMIQRGGKLIAKHVGNATERSLIPPIQDNIDHKSTIYSDQLRAYQRLGQLYDHQSVKHNQGEYVRGKVHTNTIEGFWAILKRGLYGIYHYTSRKHLHLYIDEFVFRYNSRKMKEFERFHLFLQNLENRITYQELTHG